MRPDDGGSGQHGTLSPSTSEAGVWFPARPQVGKLVVAIGQQFTVQNLDQLYILVSSALPTTHCDMTYTVLKGCKTPNKINKSRY